MGEFRLIFVIQRVQFDRETQQAYKSQAYVKFGDTICLDRFLDIADPEKRARSKDIQSKLNTSRDRILRLTHGKVSYRFKVHTVPSQYSLPLLRSTLHLPLLLEQQLTSSRNRINSRYPRSRQILLVV